MARRLAREALRFHARRLGIAALAVALVGASASIALSLAGLRDCIQRGEDVLCRERSFYVFTLQQKADLWTKNGVPHGERWEWHRTGALWLHGRYDNGVRVGVWSEFHENGRPRFLGTYVDDRLEGLETWWFPNGNKEWQADRIGGKRVGVERWWHDNGALRRVGSYNASGEKDGRFTVWDAGGAERFTGEYGNGVPTGADGEQEAGPST